MGQQAIIKNNRLRASMVVPERDGKILPESYKTVFFEDLYPVCKKTGLNITQKTLYIDDVLSFFTDHVTCSKNNCEFVYTDLVGVDIFSAPKPYQKEKNVFWLVVKKIESLKFANRWKMP